MDSKKWLSTSLPLSLFSFFPASSSEHCGCCRIEFPYVFHTFTFNQLPKIVSFLPLAPDQFVCWSSGDLATAAHLFEFPLAITPAGNFKGSWFFSGMSQLAVCFLILPVLRTDFHLCNSPLQMYSGSLAHLQTVLDQFQYLCVEGVPTPPSSSQIPAGVLQFSSILTPSTQRQHLSSHLKGSVLQDCPPLPPRTCQMRVVS